MRVVVYLLYFLYSSNQLITSVPLDYELVQQYKLRACVTDLGNLLNTPAGSGSGVGSGSKSYDSVNDLPQDHVDCIDIIVDVIDENDNNPVFVGGVTSYTYSVDEEQDNNTFVGYANVSNILIIIYTLLVLLLHCIIRLLIVILVHLVLLDIHSRELIMKSKQLYILYTIMITIIDIIIVIVLINNSSLCNCINNQMIIILIQTSTMVQYG